MDWSRRDGEADGGPPGNQGALPTLVYNRDTAKATDHVKIMEYDGRLD